MERPDRLKDRCRVAAGCPRYTFEVAQPSVTIGCTYVQPNGRGAYWKIDDPKEAQIDE